MFHFFTVRIQFNDLLDSSRNLYTKISQIRRVANVSSKNEIILMVQNNQMFPFPNVFSNNSVKSCNKRLKTKRNPPCSSSSDVILLLQPHQPFHILVFSSGSFPARKLISYESQNATPRERNTNFLSTLMNAFKTTKQIRNDCGE